MLDLEAPVQHTNQEISPEGFRNQDLRGYLNHKMIGKLHTKLRLKNARLENLLKNLRILLTMVRIHHTKQGNLVTKLRNYKGVRRTSNPLGMMAVGLLRYWK